MYVCMNTIYNTYYIHEKRGDMHLFLPNLTTRNIISYQLKYFILSWGKINKCRLVLFYQ